MGFFDFIIKHLALYNVISKTLHNVDIDIIIKLSRFLNMTLIRLVEEKTFDADSL